MLLNALEIMLKLCMYGSCLFSELMMSISGRLDQGLVSWAGNLAACFSHGSVNSGGGGWGLVCFHMVLPLIFLPPFCLYCLFSCWWIVVYFILKLGR